MRNSARAREIALLAGALAMTLLIIGLSPAPLEGSRSNHGILVGAIVDDMWTLHTVGFEEEDDFTAGLIEHDVNWGPGEFNNLALIDYDLDGKTDVGFASPPGPTSIVSFFDLNGTQLDTSQPFGPGWQGGVLLTVGNVAGNKRPEILASTETNFGQVNFFRTNGSQAGFLIPNQGFTGGIQVFAHQLVPGGRDELIVVPQSQSGNVEILGSDGSELLPNDFDPFGPNHNDGLDFAIGQWADSPAAIVTSAGRRGQFAVAFTWDEVGRDGRGTPGFSQFARFKHGFGKKGAHLAMGDVDGDGDDEIIVGARGRKKQSIRVFELDGTLLGKYAPFDKPMALTDIAAAPNDS